MITDGVQRLAMNISSPTTPELVSLVKMIHSFPKLRALINATVIQRRLAVF